MAGYSGTPLPRKLGVKTGSRVLLVAPPPEFELDPLPDGVVVHRRPGTGRYDLILAFMRSHADLKRTLPRLEQRVVRNGSIWISWPKRASGVPTDLTEDGVRRTALPRGWVDVKVCAVDGIWSALKLVLRLENR